MRPRPGAGLVSGRHVAWLGLLAAIGAGCTAGEHRTQVRLAPGQTQVQLDADWNGCHEEANRAALARTPRETAFAACMVARGYRVMMLVQAGTEHAFLDMRSTPPRETGQVADDLSACRAAAARAIGAASDAEVVASGIGGMIGFYFGQTIATAHRSPSARLAAQLLSCLEARGYTVTQWRPAE